ncbi:chemotaxis protein CheX [Myxococcota bacterium]|nr:chemotaxis protein CheX [Myxococcota bacterium]MBU1431262.1 chemotaxis protein CheX [Myxococcota bacterium]MBU1898049.1 chemotaxis protein CheX [Myxococcota bacterium]
MLSTQVEARWGLSEADLLAMTQEAWQAFGVDLEFAAARSLDQPVGSQIEINGPRAGVLQLWGERVVVEEAARRILRDAAEVPEALLADVLGEIANILGGMIKGCLEEEHTLSLPRPLEAVAFEEGGALRLGLEGHAGGAALWVRV